MHGRGTPFCYMRHMYPANTPPTGQQTGTSVHASANPTHTIPPYLTNALIGPAGIINSLPYKSGPNNCTITFPTSTLNFLVCMKNHFGDHRAAHKLAAANGATVTISEWDDFTIFFFD